MDEVGIHYGGPTWESNSGSLVVAQLKTPCEVGPADIPWLRLDQVRSQGPGIFDGVDFIPCSSPLVYPRLHQGTTGSR